MIPAIPILLALNIIAASVATPTFASGLGLGSGARGSSFEQKVRKTSDEIKMISTLFPLICDQEAWNKNKTEQQPAYPTQESDFKNLFEQSKNLGSSGFAKVCKALKSGNDGIFFVGPSGEEANGEEMFHLFSGHWDKRSLTAIYYLYQKRFGPNGYRVSCTYGGKTAPIMTLRVTAGYLDERGRATGVARDGSEDDVDALDARNVISPHARGQAIDIITFGCTIIDGEEKNVVPNRIAIGQDLNNIQAAYVTPEMLAGSTTASEAASPALLAGLNETSKASSTLAKAGVNLGDFSGLGPAQVAARIANSDVAPKIIPFETPDQNGEITFEQQAARFLERTLEKKFSLPAGALENGADLITIGRKALFDQAQIALSHDPSAQEVLDAAKELSNYKNPEVTISIPQKAIDMMASGDWQGSLKLIGAYRLNIQFGLGLSSQQVEAHAVSGLSADQLVGYISKSNALADDEKEYLLALAQGGYDALSKKLDEVQQSRDQSVPGDFIKILKTSSNLDEEGYKAIKDFLTNIEYRDAVPQRLSNRNASQAIIDWVNRNKNISDQDAKICLEAIEKYHSSSDPKEALENAYPSVHESVLRSSLSLMDQEEKTIFQSIFGSSPTSKQLKDAIDEGKLKTAGEALIYSKQLQRLGVPTSQATYLGVGLAQDSSTRSNIGLSRLNEELGKRWGVSVTKEDLTLMKNGNFEGARKLAIGAISNSTDLPVEKVLDFFDGKDDSAKSKISEAFESNPKMTEKTKAMLDGILDKKSDGGKKLADATAHAGAEAKAQAIANAGAEGQTTQEAEANRQSTSDKVEAAFDKAIDQGRESAREQFRAIMAEKNVSAEEADKIFDGKFQGAEKEVTNSLAAEEISKELKGKLSPSEIKRGLADDATPEERKRLQDALLAQRLAESGVYTDKSIADVLMKGTPQEREALMKDLGTQYSAFTLREAAKEQGITITPEQSIQIVNRNFSELDNVAGQTVISRGLASMGINVSPSVSARIYTKIEEMFKDSPAPSTSAPRSTTSTQVGVQTNAEGLSANPGDAALRQEPVSGSDIPANIGAPGSASGTGAAETDPQIMPDRANQEEIWSADSGQESTQNGTQAGEAGGTTKPSTADRIESAGWGVLEAKTGISREAITNLRENIQNLPKNIENYYKNFDYNAALSNVATCVIVNKLLGKTLAKIDPTGGILSSIAMQYATHYIASLGISMPILLGIALLIDFKGTIQALKAMVKMALMVFTDPIGFIMSFLGFGKKKPKAKAAVGNPQASENDTVAMPGDENIPTDDEDFLEREESGPPQETNFPEQPEGMNHEGLDPGLESKGIPNYLLGQKAYAADEAQDTSNYDIGEGVIASPASSNYLAPKTPSDEQFKKIARRTVDQVLEDLLLFSLAASGNRKMIALDKDFIAKHWNAYMDIKNPYSRSYAIKQLVSPRAVITQQEVEAAKALDMTDVLYAKESSEKMLGYDGILKYARALFGDNFLPSKVDKRAFGLIQNRAIKHHIHVGF